MKSSVILLLLLGVGSVMSEGKGLTPGVVSDEGCLVCDKETPVCKASSSVKEFHYMHCNERTTTPSSAMSDGKTDTESLCVEKCKKDQSCEHTTYMNDKNCIRNDDTTQCVKCGAGKTEKKLDDNDYCNTNFSCTVEKKKTQIVTYEPKKEKAGKWEVEYEGVLKECKEKAAKGAPEQSSAHVCNKKNCNAYRVFLTAERLWMCEILIDAECKASDGKNLYMTTAQVMVKVTTGNYLKEWPMTTTQGAIDKKGCEHACLRDIKSKSTPCIGYLWHQHGTKCYWLQATGTAKIARYVKCNHGTKTKTKSSSSNSGSQASGTGAGTK